MKTVTQVFKASLLSFIISGAAFAGDALTPIGSLQSQDNVIVVNEMGSFPVSGDYAVIAGDQIQTAVDSDVVAIALGNGHIYVSPDSVVTTVKTDSGYRVEIVSGSVGYKFDNQTKIEFTSVGGQVTPVSTGEEISGVIALGAEGKLVVNPILGEALVMSDAGIMTTVLAGQTWVNSAHGGKITLTQVEEGGASAALPMILAGLGLVILIAALDDDDDDDDAPVEPAPVAPPASPKPPAPVIATTPPRTPRSAS